MKRPCRLVCRNREDWLPAALGQREAINRREVVNCVNGKDGIPTAHGNLALDDEVIRNDIATMRNTPCCRVPPARPISESAVRPPSLRRRYCHARGWSGGS